MSDAPEETKLLIEEIEDLNLLLTEIETDQQRNPFSSTVLKSSATSRCLQNCKKAADRLKELTNDLRTELNISSTTRKKWACAKLVLKKDKVSRYKSRLESTIRLLTLSYQIYTRLVREISDNLERRGVKS